MRQTITLIEPVQAHKAMAAAWVHIKAHLMAGTRLVLEVRDETRRTAQNGLLHSSLSDIARQVDWCGRRLDVDVWRRLCVAAWLRELGESPEMVPALDGKGFDIVYASTTTLTVKQCASLSMWVHAFGDEHGVKWTPASLGCDWAGVDPETGEIR